MSQNNGNGRLADAERYKEAATQALEMIVWCIGYFTGTHKERIAAQLAKNRSHIRKQVREPAEPSPQTRNSVRLAARSDTLARAGLD